MDCDRNIPGDANTHYRFLAKIVSSLSCDQVRGTRTPCHSEDKKNLSSEKTANKCA